MAESRYIERQGGQKNIKRTSTEKQGIKIEKNVPKSIERFINFLIDKGMEYQSKNGNIQLIGEDFSVNIKDGQVFIIGTPSTEDLYEIHEKCVEEDIPTSNFEDKFALSVVGSMDKAVKNDDVESFKKYLDEFEKLYPSETVMPKLYELSDDIINSEHSAMFIAEISKHDDSDVIKLWVDNISDKLDLDVIYSQVKTSLKSQDYDSFESILNTLDYLYSNGYISRESLMNQFESIGEAMGDFYSKNGYFPFDKIKVKDDERKSIIDGIVSSFKDKIIETDEFGQIGINDSDNKYSYGMVMFLRDNDVNSLNANNELYNDYIQQHNVEEVPTIEENEEESENQGEPQDSSFTFHSVKIIRPKTKTELKITTTKNVTTSRVVEFDVSAGYIEYHTKDEASELGLNWERPERASGERNEEQEHAQVTWDEFEEYCQNHGVNIDLDSFLTSTYDENEHLSHDDFIMYLNSYLQDNNLTLNDLQNHIGNTPFGLFLQVVYINGIGGIPAFYTFNSGHLEPVDVTFNMNDVRGYFLEHPDIETPNHYNEGIDDFSSQLRDIARWVYNNSHNEGESGEENENQNEVEPQEEPIHLSTSEYSPEQINELVNNYLSNRPSDINTESQSIEEMIKNEETTENPIILSPYNIYGGREDTEEEEQEKEQESVEYRAFPTDVYISDNTPLTIDVYDSTGRKVTDAEVSYTIENGKAHIKAKLPDDSPSGMYFVNVMFEQDGRYYHSSYKKVLVK